MKGIILALFGFVAINAYAQVWSNDVYKQGDIYPGYIIDKAGKKTEGFIEMRNRYVMQNTILFYFILTRTIKNQSLRLNQKRFQNIQ